MGTLYLVRHGQASFGAINYDQLSPLGRTQSERLGAYLRNQSLCFETALTGTLQRHLQTWHGMCAGAGGDAGPLAPLPTLTWPGLNEYDSEAVIRAIHPEPLEHPDTPEQVRHHFRLLRAGLTQWMAGVVSPKGMPAYRDFVAGVTSALDHVKRHCSGNVLLVSSGGPIATAVGHILGTPAETTIELNLRIRNSAVTEFQFNPKHCRLVSFNSIAHLENQAAMITYA
jgi:broad specificity phosphatase PhoE